MDSENEGGQDEEQNVQDGEEEDQFEQMFEMKTKDVWQSGGPKRNETIRELIKCFGSMIKSIPMEYAIPDNKGRYRQEDLTYVKLLDASKYVVKAKRYDILFYL